MSNIYSIYKATNVINGKCYIGFDSNWPHRQQKHKIKSQSNCLYYFHKAIQKYGWDNFKWEILYQSIDGLHCLNVMEPYFIEQYDSFKNGYNMTLGGEGCIGYKHTPETIAKLKILFKKPKKPQTQQHKDKRAEKRAKYWKIITPNKDTYIIKNLAKFCKINNLNDNCMRDVVYGRNKQHKGYKCFRF